MSDTVGDAERALADRAAQAALARAASVGSAGPSIAQQEEHIRRAARDFNAEVIRISDRLHFSMQYILEAVELIDKVLRDLVQYGGKKPADATVPMRIKSAVLRKKTHEIEPAYKAIQLLGFREQVISNEKHLEYHGRFPDAAQNARYLAAAKELLDTTVRDIKRHAGVGSADKVSQKRVQEHLRQQALAQFEADRAKQKERKEREALARAAAAAAPDLAAEQAEGHAGAPAAVGARGAVAASPLPPFGGRRERPSPVVAPRLGIRRERDEPDNNDVDHDESDGEGQGTGVRRRFVGVGHRLGGVEAHPGSTGANAAAE